jgi:hypothetical protein
LAITVQVGDGQLRANPTKLGASHRPRLTRAGSLTNEHVGLADDSPS